MKTLTFRGGVHPPDKKRFSEDIEIISAPLPEKVYLFLDNHAGVTAKPLVKEGEKVKTGQKIAEAGGFISADLHASITGTVEAIEKYYHPTLQKPRDAIVIKRDTDEEWEYLEPAKSYKDFNKDQLVNRIKNAGIVGLGGAMFPTNVKLSPPKDKKIDLLIINGAECEPYLTIDYRMMLEFSEEIVKGTMAIKRALDIKDIVIGIENNKPEAIKKMKEVCKGTGIRVEALKTKYPQGAEKQLIYAVSKRKVPSGGLPMDVGAVVQNVGTTYAIYEAIEKGKPLVERGLTITGEGIYKPINVVARIGTMADELIDIAGGLNEEQVDRVIFGGPMMGIAVPRINIPIIKGTSGITIMSKEATKATERETMPCIRCGSCVDSCPMFLLPFQLNLYADNRLYNKAVEEGLLDCIECGSCSYACPSNIDLVKSFKLAKKVYKAMKGGGKR
ncbi:MAG: electron transport complex subunit RsxC [Kosmotoga sp.]|nr:MAG: electron transport complex subunit RsxC [Kosmotoga sp.]